MPDIGGQSKLVEDRLERGARQAPERRRRAHHGKQLLLSDLPIGDARDDLLRQHVEWIARIP